MRTYDYSYDCKENYYALLVAILDNKSVSKALKAMGLNENEVELKRKSNIPHIDKSQKTK